MQRTPQRWWDTQGARRAASYAGAIALLVLGAPTLGAQTGSWGTPVQHNVTVAPGFTHVPGAGINGRRFNALHMALIPQPATNAGLVLVWDAQGQAGASGGWYQRWSIIDPSTDPPTVLWNDELFIPGASSGDLFCSGHAWMPDGRLFVAGGTTFYPPPSGNFFGALLALAFDPTPTGLEPYGRWTILPRMAKHRWYPTVTLDGSGNIVVSGGTHIGGGENTYEVYQPSTNSWQIDSATSNPWFPGPTSGSTPLFSNYPRMHLLANGNLFMSSPDRRAAVLDHVGAPGSWTITGLSSTYRGDGASVLFPLPFSSPDVVLIQGGTGGSVVGPLASAEFCLPQTLPAPWIPGPSTIRKREHVNTVLLPDGSLVTIGGNDRTSTTPPTSIFWKDAEWLGPSLTWTMLATGASNRDYHSTAVLLPDGNVLSAGGDNREWDYQLFVPPYFDNPALPRPTNVTLSSTELSYFVNGDEHSASFSLSSGSIARVVLMAPGSTTHHSDMGQRFVDLPIASQTPGSVTFSTPWDSCTASTVLNFCAPAGYYMLFLISDQGVPSEAVFVRLS